MSEDQKSNKTSGNKYERKKIAKTRIHRKTCEDENQAPGHRHDVRKDHQDEQPTIEAQETAPGRKTPEKPPSTSIISKKTPQKTHNTGTMYVKMRIGVTMQKN